MIMNLVATISVDGGCSAVFVWRRRDAWLARRFERDDQLVALFVMILAANAVISYPYTKDVIMSPAGAFFAVAGFAAVRNVLTWLPGRACRLGWRRSHAGCRGTRERARGPCASSART